VHNVQNALAAIAAIVQPGDVVLTMGAGSIGGVPAQLRALQQAAG
jgi:UDP-N-acetylmuramate--alanine ligase